MLDPILIMAQPRSGSSMTAGIFHQHGVWAGTSRHGSVHNIKGFYENLPLKRLVKTFHGAIVNKGTPAKQVPGFREQVLQTIRNDGYREGPWMWKGSAMYYPGWFEFTPKVVCVFRDPESVFASCRSSNMLGSGLSDDELMQNILFHQQFMRDMNGFNVSTDEVVAGNYDSLEKAITGCGLVFDKAIVDRFVEPDQWHFTTSPTITT